MQSEVRGIENTHLGCSDQEPKWEVLPHPREEGMASQRARTHWTTVGNQLRPVHDPSVDLQSCVMPVRQAPSGQPLLFPVPTSDVLPW